MKPCGEVRRTDHANFSQQDVSCSCNRRGAHRRPCRTEYVEHIGRGSGGGGGGLTIQHGNHGNRGGRGGGRGGRGGSAGRGGNAPQEKPKKEAILNLAKYVDKQIRVKFAGSREGMFLHNLLTQSLARSKATTS